MSMPQPSALSGSSMLERSEMSPLISDAARACLPPSDIESRIALAVEPKRFLPS